MKNSNFQFQNPRIIECSFIDNLLFSGKEKQTLPFTLSHDIKRTESDNKATVSLTAEIGSENKEDVAYPFYLKIIITAGFKWEKDAFEEPMINDLLNYNAPTLLISYIRPMISSILLQTRHKAFDLPFIDMRKIAEKNINDDTIMQN